MALTASLASTNIGGPSFLCGMVNTIGLPELLASLPPKHVADKLIRTFFDENDSLVPSLRTRIFTAIYDRLIMNLTICNRYFAQAYFYETGTPPELRLDPRLISQVVR